MPSIYSSNIFNAIQLTNESDGEIHVETNTSIQRTTQPLYTTSISYISATPPAKGLSTAEIVLILLGVIVFVILLCVLIFCMCRRRKRHKPPPKVATPKSSTPLVTPAAHWVKPKPAAQPPRTPHHFKSDPASSVAPPAKPSPGLPRLQCRQPLCKEYLARLKLSEAYFESQYDKCFCKKCHNLSNSDANCGSWCRPFHGWIRFGLRLSKAHKNQWKIFKEWQTSYYGTSPDRLSSILRNRFVPLDYDLLADGTAFSSGHPDTNYCVTSPSLAYASQHQFTPRLRFRAIDGNDYHVQVVLQCKQQPDTTIIRTDPKSSENIEWATKARSSVVPFGLLIRLQKV